MKGELIIFICLIIIQADNFFSPGPSLLITTRGCAGIAGYAL